MEYDVYYYRASGVVSVVFVANSTGCRGYWLPVTTVTTPPIVLCLHCQRVASP